MNAYELADELQKFYDELDGSFGYLEQSINMLRQQANQIAKLEKQGKPVAWMQMHYKDNVPTKFSPVKVWEDDIPLYTTPQTKPLSNDEILEMTIWNKNLYELYVEMEKEDMIAFARTIEERHGIK